MRLNELRRKKGVTQKTVAEAIGCAVNNYARYERGDRMPDVATFKLLSKYFCVSIDYIVCND